MKQKLTEEIDARIHSENKVKESNKRTFTTESNDEEAIFSNKRLMTEPKV